MQNTYEYRIYIDEQCRGDIWNQIIKARRLYNDLIAAMRTIYDEMQTFTMEKAGEDAARITARIATLNAQFKDAKAADNEAGMKDAAELRRECWKELSPILKNVRKEHKNEIQERFLSRIGNNSSTDTYPIRCKYVDEGLGFGTATAVLDRALTAWKKRFALGKPPEFASAADKLQDTLVLQFTAAGGLPADAILTGKSKELSIDVAHYGSGKRNAGEFTFRLGLAKDKKYATGNIIMHRALPEGCNIPGARLVCRRVANREKYYLQLVVSHDTGVIIDRMPNKKPMIAVHFGWNSDISGRRVAGINDTPDVSTASIIQLPVDIEESLEYASQIQAARDAARDEIHPRLKEIELTGDEAIDEEWAKIKRLPAQHLEQARLHKLIERCWKAGYEDQPAWLKEWKSLDKKRWQAEIGVASKARVRREQYYTMLARSWCGQYRAIVLEMPDLKEAAIKVNELTGEKSEFNRKARAGQRIAALFEFEQVIRWQAKKAGVAVFEENPESVATCAHCGSGGVVTNDADYQMLDCPSCGAQTDRKENGATILYQVSIGGIEERTSAYHQEAIQAENAKAIKKAEKLLKMQQGRRDRIAARTQSDGENAAGSRMD